MRKIVLLGLLFCSNLYSQNIVSQLKDFISHADMNCYLDQAQQHIREDHLIQCQWWETDTLSAPIPRINLRNENVVPMLTLQFLNTEDYDYGDIYDYITIDSTRVFSYACLDIENEVTAFVNFFDGVFAYLPMKDFHPLEKKGDKLVQVIDNLRKEQPEQLLYCNALYRAIVPNGFMYLKGDKIYVYRVAECESVELNYYIREFLSLYQIRNLNQTPVLSLYRTEKDNDASYIRRTGQAPENKSLLCPPLE